MNRWHPVHSTVAGKLAESEALCRRHAVKRLDLFGSAATGRFDPDQSDLDFLVEFLPNAPKRAFAGYFELKEDLEKLFGREVDLVEAPAIRNQYFKEEVEATRVSVYAA
jgi:predicted nucleotidyltransferase